ncbi:MAG: hypothetical protein PVSMB5_25550 [Ktedonobacteraceae bacterium]
MAMGKTRLVRSDELECHTMEMSRAMTMHTTHATSALTVNQKAHDFKAHRPHTQTNSSSASTPVML